MIFNIRIYYGDTDAGGVVFHAAYVNFYDRARTEFFRSHDITAKELAEMNCVFVVRKISLEYLSPSFLDDFLSVTTVISEYRKTSLRLVQTIIDHHGNVINQSDVLLVFVDLLKKKAIRMPSDILEKLTLL